MTGLKEKAARIQQVIGNIHRRHSLKHQVLGNRDTAQQGITGCLLHMDIAFKSRRCSSLS